MGTRQRDTERAEAMYLLFFLLISPAFGMQCSGLDFGAGIVNQLDSVVGFTLATQVILDSSKLIDVVSEALEEAEQNILAMDTELHLLETEELKFEDSYFPKYNKAKRHLRETRQGLRRLADRTIKEVRDLKTLLEDLDKHNDTVILRVTIDKMKDLMIETLVRLKEARKKYNSALDTFEDINSSVGRQNRKLEKMSNKNSAEYKEWTTRLRAGVYGTIGATTTGCIIADALGALGICSAISVVITGTSIAVTEAKIAEYGEKLQKFKTITDRMLESGYNFEKNINEAIDILIEEIELINQWANSAELVSKNIEKYPVESLRKYQTIRTIFINGLDDLDLAAKNFLARPIDIL